MSHRFARATMAVVAICGSSSTGTLAAKPVHDEIGETPARTTVRAAAKVPQRSSSPVRQGATDLNALAGSWKVTAVQVEDSNVQALVKNDPSYMGAVLKITPVRLSWQPHKGGELSDVCDGPRLARDGEVSCRSGEFGPPDTKLVADGKTIKLDWYDGGTLVLSRLR